MNSAASADKCSVFKLPSYYYLFIHYLSILIILLSCYYAIFQSVYLLQQIIKATLQQFVKKCQVKLFFPCFLVLCNNGATFFRFNILTNPH